MFLPPIAAQFPGSFDIITRTMDTVTIGPGFWSYNENWVEFTLTSVTILAESWIVISINKTTLANAFEVLMATPGVIPISTASKWIKPLYRVKPGTSRVDVMHDHRLDWHMGSPIR
jgi:hypothetical protein